MKHKINEFVNNKLSETFDKLKNDLFYETAHLSDPYEKVKSKYFQEILSYGKEILPLVMDEIKKDDVCGYTLCIIALNLIDKDSIKIDESKYGVVSEIRKHLLEWWEENKVSYEQRIL
jgi:hypothetical protein